MWKIRILEWESLYVSESVVTLPEIVEVDRLDPELVSIAAEEAATVDINNFGGEIGITVTEWEVV